MNQEKTQMGLAKDSDHYLIGKNQDSVKIAIGKKKITRKNAKIWKKKNREKGQRFENKIRSYLQSIGFVVDKARASFKWTPVGIFSSRNDFWGFADLIAFHKEKPYTLVIQAHNGSNLKPRMEKGFSLSWNLNSQRVQIWSPAGNIRSGIRIHWLRQVEGVENPAQWIEHIIRLENGIEPYGGVI